VPDDDLSAALPSEPAPQPVRVLDAPDAAPEADLAAPLPVVTTPPLRPAARRAAPGKAPAKAAAKKTPAKKAPAKAAPAKAGPAKAVSKAPAKRAAATKAPVKKAPAQAPAVAAVPVLEVPAAAPAPATVDFAELLGIEPAPPRSMSGAARFVLTLVALLLAGAVGMGAAALVESGQETWRSSVTVRLTPGTAPSGDAAAAVTAGQRRYADKLPTLTTAIATAAGVPQGDVRRDLRVRSLGGDRLEVAADAASAAEAKALAVQVANTLVNGIPGDQAATVTNPGDRLGALLSDYPTTPERTRPSDVLAVVVGVVAATAVLLLALSLALLARGSDD
jgi:hypothetical protein